MVLSLIKWSLLPFLHLLHDKFVIFDKKEIDTLSQTHSGLTMVHAAIFFSVCDSNAI